MVDKTIFVGKYFKELESVDSTNSFAAELVKKNEAKHGMIVFTTNQTKGKGQREKVWNSEQKKNLTFSLTIKTDFLLVSEQFFLGMAISNAVWEYIYKKLEGLDATVFIKWPNDVLINNQKVAGILIENTINTNSLGWSIVGIGINLNQEIFELLYPSNFKPVSLKHFLKNDLNIISELELLSEYLEKWLFKLNKREFKLITERYKQCLWNIGRTIKFENKENELIDGFFLNIDESGVPIIIDLKGKTYYFSETKSVIYN
jgi:BirA family biotin operon repressor/biotin-[acetyl-CoA-carboxylase] ligase